MESQKHSRLQRIFSPRHIAVIGASTKNQWFANCLLNARQMDDSMRFYPVNPNAAEVFGVAAYPSVQALPSSVDFAVVVVKAILVPGVLKELDERGIRNVLLISSGFAEVGQAGASLQDDMSRFCRAHDILLMGPNCLGFINPTVSASVFAGGSVEGRVLSGGIGVIAQSGAASEVMVSKLLKKSLGISLYVTTGNEAVLTTEDCLEYLVHEEHTKVITAFIEGFRAIERLKTIARKAAEKGVPIVLIKVGRSSKARQAAQSHTGAMAGNDAVLDGFFRQQGIIRVDSIEELAETVNLLARCPLPAGDGFGLCTLSGGLCGMYADLCHQCGISVPSLAPATVARLKALLPDFAQPDNPLDLTGAGFFHGMDAILEALIADPNLDIIAPLTIPPAHAEDALADNLNNAFLGLMATSPKPLVPIAFREVGDHARAYYQDHGVPYIDHAELGFKAIAHLMEYAAFQRRIKAGAQD